MTVDLRPPAVPVQAWPGQTRTVTVTPFPAGYLTGKDHEWRLVRDGRSTVDDTTTAAIDGVSLVATIEIPDLTGEWDLTLYDTTGALEEPRVTLPLDVNREASEEQTDITVPVTIDTGDIEVTLDVTLSEGAGGGQVDEVVAGPGIAVDATDPAAPVVTAEVTQQELTDEAAARTAADLQLIPLTQKGAANGVATLGADSKIPSAQLPALAIGEVFTAASQAAMLALTAQRGDIAVRTDLDPDGVFILTTDAPGTLADWVQITAPGAVISVDGQTGAVSLSATYVASDDVREIVASLTQAEIDAIPSPDPETLYIPTDGDDLLQAALDLLAPKASPALTGTPTSPTAAPGTNTTQIANTAFVAAAVAALINSAPGALDTLDELAAALGDDANFAATLTAALALKAPLADPTFTGNVVVPDADAATEAMNRQTGDARYPQITNDRLWLGPDRFLLQGGSPVMVGSGGTGSNPAVLYDAASQENTTVSFIPPVGWATVDIDLWWYNHGAGAGDVRWRMQLASHTDGSATVTTVADQSRNETAAAQNVVTRRVAFMAGAAVDPTKLYRISLLRIAADAADTLANDAGLLGLMIRRAS